MTTYRIAKYQADDETAVAEFQQLLWQGGPARNRAYLKWKYEKNPYLDYRYVLLGWERNELCGMMGAFGARWQAGTGERMMIPCLSDTLIAPAHRGSPLFLSMADDLVTRLGADGIAWLMDFGDQGAAPALLMRGWTLIGPWPFATARRSESVPQSAWVATGGGDSFRGARSGVEIRASLATPNRAVLAAMAALAAALPTNGVRHVVDVEYLKWRFSNPLARYHFMTAGTEPFVGYLVVHRTQVDEVDGATPTTIVDCEAPSDEVWMDLIAASVERAPGRTLLMWARDLCNRRLGLLEAGGFEMDRPSGRLTRDWHLPHLILRATAELPGTSPFARLDSSSAWDLRSVCGRCWR